MNILVTNDDGILAPGLLALAQQLRLLGTVAIVAPDHNWSASGHVKTLTRPMRAKPVKLADGSEGLACDGAPSDCVALALLGLVSGPIDLVVSGINPNANIGHDVTYSGTVMAAMEAVIDGVAGMAVSLDAHDSSGSSLDFTAAAVCARRVAAVLTSRPLPERILYNVNVPNLPLDELKGLRISRQGMRIYRDELVRREDPRGRPYYWIGGDPPSGVEESGTDYGDIHAGYVSITPLQVDMTAHTLVDEMNGWGWEM